MTIEERAESVAVFKKFDEGMNEKDVILHNILMQGRREGYIKGATEQKAVDIEKACEWLMKYFVIDHEGMSPSECDIFLRKFRKAMEE